eukprot:730866_1
MSLSSIFFKSECILKFVDCLSKPSYHPKNKDVAIVSADKGIYEYNTKTNTFNEIYTYDQTFNPEFHGQFIDSKNELLYIFGGLNGTFGIFDLNTKIMNTNTESVLRHCCGWPKSTYIPSP